MRTLLNRYRFHQPLAAKERLTLPWQIGGRGFIDVIRVRDKKAKLLQTYVLNKQFTSSLHAAGLREDDRCTPQDSVRANVNELHTDEEYNKKDKRQRTQKNLAWPPSV